MKKVAILLEEGFEEIEALTVVDVLRRANIKCDMVSLRDEYITGSHNITIKSDRVYGEDLKEYDLIVLPGGMPGSRNLKGNNKVIDLVRYFNEKNKLIAAICAAPIVLGEAGIVEDKKITSYPGFEEEIGKCIYINDEKVVVDQNIITSRGPATTLPFSYKILELLGYEDYEKMSKAMLYK